MNELQQDIPLWAYVDLFTMSDISFLYSISEPPIKDAVARTFDLTMSKGASILGSYMHSMTIIRNLCAHGSRIYNRLFEQKPSLNKREKALLIKDSSNSASLGLPFCIGMMSMVQLPISTTTTRPGKAFNWSETAT